MNFLLVFEQSPYLEIIQDLMKLSQDVEVVQTSPSLEQAVLKSYSSRPDLVLFDYDTLNTQPDYFIRSLRQHLPDSMLYGLTEGSPARCMPQALAAGADRLVSKDELIQNFFSLLHLPPVRLYLD